MLSVLDLDMLYGLPTIKLSLSIGEGLLPGPSQKLKSADTQVSYIKWHSTFGPICPWKPKATVNKNFQKTKMFLKTHVLMIIYWYTTNYSKIQ